MEACPTVPEFIPVRKGSAHRIELLRVIIMNTEDYKWMIGANMNMTLN